MKNLTLALIVLFLLVLSIQAQTTRDEAIALFNKGDIEGSFPLLLKAAAENGRDAEIQSYLGIAYLRRSDAAKGIACLEKAVKLQPSDLSHRSNLASAYLVNGDLKKAGKEADRAISAGAKIAAAYYVRGRVYLKNGKFDLAGKDADTVLSIDPANARGHTLKVDSLFEIYIESVKKTLQWKEGLNKLSEAKRLLKDCLKTCSGTSERDSQEKRLELIEAFLAAGEEKILDFNEKPIDIEAGSTRVKILDKTRPAYTDKARMKGVEGTINLLMVFGADGNIPYIFILNKLGSGLDENALIAASKIKFDPATINGKPRTSIAIMKYSFSIY